MGVPLWDKDFAIVQIVACWNDFPRMRVIRPGALGCCRLLQWCNVHTKPVFADNIQQDNRRRHT